MTSRRFAILFAASCVFVGCANTDDISSDMCPDNPDKDLPGICGCQEADVDADNNGIMDCLEDKIDLCPEDPNKTKPGICGCGVSDEDLDHNHVADCIDKVADLCPEDETKTVPGVCGCGTPDVDTDGDQVPDCIDKCPENVNLTAPGACGCDDAIDQDGDGVPICMDACDNNAKKTKGGICGCLSDDTYENMQDDDNDGVMNCLDACPNNPFKSAEGSEMNGCEIADSDRDGIDDKDDKCPYNPNVGKEDGVDCNYVTDADGTKVFEVWTPYDLKTLGDEVQKHYKKEQRQPGSMCHLQDEAFCAEPGISPDVMQCVLLNSQLNLYTWQRIPGDFGKACVEGANGIEIKPFECKQGSELSVGVCCNSEFVSTCSGDKKTLYQCNSSLKAIEAVSCPTGCEATQTEAGTEVGACVSCLGEPQTQDGEPGQCCDIDSYQASCTDEKTVLRCQSGRLENAECAGGCSVTTDGAVQCTSCVGEVVSTGGEVDSCCNTNNYTETCSEDGYRLSCVNGRVTKNACMGGCTTYNNASRIWCVSEPEHTDTQLNVRIMQDIDLGDAIKREDSNGSCVGQWNPVDLMETIVDGNGKTIRFGTGDKRCSMTQPIFGDVTNSTIKNLTLDFDVRGGANQALLYSSLRSLVEDISWQGTVTRTLPIYGEYTQYGSVMAYSAQESVFKGITFNGNINNYVNKYAGIVALANQSVLKDIVIESDDIYSLDADIYLLSYQPTNSLLKNVKFDVDSVLFEGVKAGVYFAPLFNSNSQSNVQDADITIDSFSNQNVQSNFFGAGYNVYNAYNVNIKLNDIKSYYAYGAAYYLSGSGVNIDIDRLGCEQNCYGLASSLAGQVSNVDSHIKKVGVYNNKYDSYIYGILYSCDYSLSDSAFEIDQMAGYSNYLIRYPYSGCKLNNLSVYANELGKNLSLGTSYSTFSLMYESYGGSFSRMALSSTHFSIGGFEEDGTPTNVTPYYTNPVVVGGFGSDSYSTSSSFSKVYWLKKNSQQVAVNRNYASIESKFTPFASSANADLSGIVNNLNADDSKKRWGTKNVTEYDGTTIVIPWFNVKAE